MNIVKTMHREISLRLVLVTRHYLRIYWLKYLHITPPIDIEISLKTHHIPRAFFFFLVQVQSDYLLSGDGLKIVEWRTLACSPPVSRGPS